MQEIYCARRVNALLNCLYCLYVDDIWMHEFQVLLVLQNKQDNVFAKCAEEPNWSYCHAAAVCSKPQSSLKATKNCNWSPAIQCQGNDKILYPRSYSCVDRWHQYSSARLQWYSGNHVNCVICSVDCWLIWLSFIAKLLYFCILIVSITCCQVHFSFIRLSAVVLWAYPLRFS